MPPLAPSHPAFAPGVGLPRSAGHVLGCQQYGAKDLAIVGISVSEERAIVEKFLREYPRAYSVALTTENELGRPYQAGPLPLYILIGRDGKFTAAVDGDQGMPQLHRLLKQAGLATE